MYCIPFLLLKKSFEIIWKYMIKELDVSLGNQITFLLSSHLFSLSIFALD